VRIASSTGKAGSTAMECQLIALPRFNHKLELNLGYTIKNAMEALNKIKLVNLEI
jgi:hypothetical protein